MTLAYATTNDESVILDALTIIMEEGFEPCDEAKALGIDELSLAPLHHILCVTSAVAAFVRAAESEDAAGDTPRGHVYDILGEYGDEVRRQAVWLGESVKLCQAPRSADAPR